jgi:UDP-N-acetylmuramoyl-tripeptide--D-alanyl-D-alanine ligase
MISDEAGTHNPSLPVQHFDDKETLTETLRAELREGDLVLIKGSRGVRMETVIAGLLPTAERNGE